MKELLLKLIGYDFTYHNSPNVFKMTWGEFAWHPKKPELSLQISSDGYEQAQLVVRPLFFSVYVNLPFTLKRQEGKYGEDRRYGFYVYDWESISFLWNYNSWSWRFPFVSWEWEKTEILDYDRKTVYEENEKNSKFSRENWDRREAIQKSVSKTFDYTYVTKNAQIQDRKATVHVERRTWYRKWFPFLKIQRTSIDISFNEEVGELCGSWKGGCTACGWTLKDNETPEQALRRMERERKFR